MKLTGKVKEIRDISYNGKEMYEVIITKTKSFGKKSQTIEIAVTFTQRYAQDIKDEKLRAGMKIDIQFYVYSKPYLSQKSGKTQYNTHVVAEKWREYQVGAPTYREIYTKDGEVIKRKGELPNNDSFDNE